VDPPPVPTLENWRNWPPWTLENWRNWPPWALGGMEKLEKLVPMGPGDGSWRWPMELAWGWKLEVGPWRWGTILELGGAYPHLSHLSHLHPRLPPSNPALPLLGQRPPTLDAPNLVQ
jgi:hypothetical protein